MDGSSRETFLTCRNALTAGRPHRLWSLIVTVFGDLAQEPGSSISGAALGQITDLIGVKPEAMRVALHRLRKDGWIESVREGRMSLHRLTDYGRLQCAEASPRIYGPEPSSSVPVHLLLADDGLSDSRRHLETYALTDLYVQINAHALVGPGEPPEDVEGLFLMRNAEFRVPDWLKEKICPAHVFQEYCELLRALKIVEFKVGSEPDLELLEVAALRTLVVHSWRRVLLRHPSLPVQFFPDNWKGPECRFLVDRILRQLVSPELALSRI